MKKNRLTPLPLFFALCFLSLCFSCQNMQKNRKIKQFDEFITEVATKHKTYSTEEWKKQDEKFDAFCTFFEDSKISSILSQEEKDKVATLTGKYKGYRLKSQLKESLFDILAGLKETGKELEGMMAALKE